MRNFERGDLVQVVGWDFPGWENHIYVVHDSYTKYHQTYYNILLTSEDTKQSKVYPASYEGAFIANHLKYVGPRQGAEVDLLKLSVPELASLVAQATARIIELTKNS